MPIGDHFFRKKLRDDMAAHNGRVRIFIIGVFLLVRSFSSRLAPLSRSGNAVKT